MYNNTTFLISDIYFKGLNKFLGESQAKGVTPKVLSASTIYEGFKLSSVASGQDVQVYVQDEYYDQMQHFFGNYGYTLKKVSETGDVVEEGANKVAPKETVKKDKQEPQGEVKHEVK